jgi:hypothetical protein
VREQPEGAPALIGGYTVLRKLASGSRSELYLGHSHFERSARSVAIKVFRSPPETEPADDLERERSGAADPELAVLGGSGIVGLPRLLDVASLPDGRVALVLERLGGGTLASLLLGRRRFEPGEAVTILAPVAVALAGLHALGYSHSTLGPASVTFDAEGRPVLTGLGGLRELPPYGTHRAQPAVGRLDVVRDDYARLTALMRGVFAHLDTTTVTGRQSEPIAAWFEMATSAVPFTPCLDQLERRLFAWTRACPVRLVADEETATSPVPARLQLSLPLDDRGVDDDREADSDREPALRSWFRILQLPSDLAGTVLRTLESGRRPAVPAWLSLRLAGKRRAIVVAACVTASITILALTLLPEAGNQGAGRARLTSEGAQGPDDASQGTPAVGPVERAVLEGDDPVLAAPHLLRIRALCLEQASVVCLDSVNQAGSATMSADSYTVRMVQQGGPPASPVDYSSYQVILVERTGDSALVELAPDPGAEQKQPASLLLMKGEAGWRLREIFENENQR